MPAAIRADDPRRATVVSAVLRLTAAGGLDAVSVRTVAAEAGCSVGLVQRLFGTKDDLLRYAMDAVLTRLAERIARKMVSLSVPAERVEALALFLVSAGEPEEREEGMVWLAFLARAVVVPELAAELRAHYAPGYGAVVDAVREGRAAGSVAPEVDPEQAATVLIALVDGLTAHVLLGRVSLESARRAVRDHVRALFGGDYPGSS